MPRRREHLRYLEKHARVQVQAHHKKVAWKVKRMRRQAHEDQASLSSPSLHRFNEYRTPTHPDTRPRRPHSARLHTRSHTRSYTRSHTRSFRDPPNRSKHSRRSPNRPKHSGRSPNHPEHSGLSWAQSAPVIESNRGAKKYYRRLERNREDELKAMTRVRRRIPKKLILCRFGKPHEKDSPDCPYPHDHGDPPNPFDTSDPTRENLEGISCRELQRDEHKKPKMPPGALFGYLKQPVDCSCGVCKRCIRRVSKLSKMSIGFLSGTNRSDWLYKATPGR